MIEHKELITIYTQLSTSTSSNDGFNNSYYILYVFNDMGLVEYDILKDLYDETYKESISSNEQVLLGPFLSFESLQNYCYKLCVELESPKIILNSIEDYNRCIESSNNNENLILSLLGNEKALENLEVNQSKGILGKIFS